MIEFKFWSRELIDSQENAGNLDAAIEKLLNEEKHARLAGDVSATRNAVTDILRLCFEARAWKTLNDQIVLLSKRRGQLKQARDRYLFVFHAEQPIWFLFLLIQCV